MKTLRHTRKNGHTYRHSEKEEKKLMETLLKNYKEKGK